MFIMIIINVAIEVFIRQIKVIFFMNLGTFLLNTN